MKRNGLDVVLGGVIAAMVLFPLLAHIRAQDTKPAAPATADSSKRLYTPKPAPMPATMPVPDSQVKELDLYNSLGKIISRLQDEDGLTPVIAHRDDVGRDIVAHIPTGYQFNPGNSAATPPVAPSYQLIAQPAAQKPEPPAPAQKDKK